MNWSDLTVQQFQQLTALGAMAAKPVDKLERDSLAEQVVGICYNLTDHQVDSLTVLELNNLCAELAFLKDTPEWRPVKHVTIDGRRYRFIYDVQQIRAARNMEVKTYGADGLIPSLHKVAASMVVPQRRNWLRQWFDDTYDAAKHEQYAADILQAPITAIYGSALFFCEVWKTSMPIIADYLTSTIPTERREEARQLLLDSCRYMGGSTIPHALPST